MNMLKRIRFSSKWLLTCSVSALVSVSAHAGIVVPKPAPHENQNPEMARVLARVGNYTVVGAEQETRTIPGEVFSNEPSQFQGTVYLFNGTTAAPERVYQFPGWEHTMDRAGWSVAMSNQWVAFVATPYNKATKPRDLNQAYIYIAGKTNGAWVSCPTLNSVANNCNESYRDNGSSVVKPLTRIAFGTRPSNPEIIDELNLNRFSMAISDKYLVLADSDKSIVKFYRYDTTSKNWILEFNVDDDDYKNFGKAVAISGEKIVVSATWQGMPNVYNGIVRIYQRDTVTGTWGMISQADGNFGSSNFGYKLEVDGNNLVVASGTTSSTKQLTFFRIGSNDRLTGEYYVVNVPGFTERLSLSGDTLAVSGAHPEVALAIYSRNTASSTLEWKRTAGLKHDFYASRNASGLGYPGADEVEVVGDNLSLGWRVFNATTPNFFYGAVLHEKVSLLDTCREPKNLVINCSFDDVNNVNLNGNASGANWTLLNHQGAAGSANYTGRQLKVSISNPGSNVWHIQARTPVNLSQAVKYVLTFRAKADSARSFVVNIGHNGNQDNNWQSYGQVNVSATTDWTEYNYEFQGVPMDANAFLDFNFGNAGTSAVTIDSVSLKAIN